MTYNFKISGLDCANCARELEEELNKINGVTNAVVDFMAQKVIAECSAEALQKVKDCCNNFEDVKVVQEDSASLPSSADGKICGEKLNITGLCCANCARELEEDLNKIDGVSATVDFVNMRIILNSVSSEAREKAVYTITHFEDVKITDGKSVKKPIIKEKLKDIICIAVAAVLLVPALVLDFMGIAKANTAVQVIVYVLYGISYLAVGHPVLINTVKNLLKGKIFDENFLMTVASVGAILLGIFAGDGFFEGVAVMLLYQLGELFITSLP